MDISDITYEQRLEQRIAEYERRLEKRIAELEREVGMWRKHVVELEAKLDFARAQLILANGYMSKAALKRFRKALGEAE